MTGTLVQNASSNGWIIQKFGGTSVGKFPDKIAEDIIRYDIHHLNMHRLCSITNRAGLSLGARSYIDEHKVVVVCSARSTGKKVTGTTSR